MFVNFDVLIDLRKILNGLGNFNKELVKSQGAYVVENIT